MKKYSQAICFLLLGVIIGVVCLCFFQSKAANMLAYMNTLTYFADVGKLVFQIYISGDDQSAIIALNYLIDRLQQYREDSEHDDDFQERAINDIAICHARLFKIYQNKGDFTSADIEYEKYIHTMKLLCHDDYAISKEELLAQIKELDHIGQREAQ
ncbi:hypothetical protein JXQ70_03235 [bacterium]|nr:hypothetical protein [bacterium]